jgi:hypothetical protein
MEILVWSSSLPQARELDRSTFSFMTPLALLIDAGPANGAQGGFEVLPTTEPRIELLPTSVPLPVPVPAA